MDEQIIQPRIRLNKIKGGEYTWSICLYDSTDVNELVNIDTQLKKEFPDV